MVRNTHWKPLCMLALAVAVVGSSGCATRGFVRNEVRTVNGRVDNLETATGAASEEAQRAHALAKSGDTRAQQALRQAEVAREIALGNVKREEVRKDAVHFKFDSAALSDESRATLDRVADEVRANPNYMVLVSGYTDATGDVQYNVGLAQRRASAVNLHLAEKLGADFVRVAFIGFGEIQPVAENNTPEGRQMNRRAEVAIVRPVPVDEAGLKVLDPKERETTGSTGPS